MKRNFRAELSALAMAFAALAIPGGATAEPIFTNGEIGLSFGHLDVDEFRDAEAGVGFAGIDGSYSFALNDRLLLGLDAQWRRDDLSSHPDFDDTEDPESQTMLGAHLLWSLGAETRLGGFAVYGDTRMRDEDRAANYDYVLLGIEARHFFTRDIMGFTQIAKGAKVRDGDDAGEGFNNGAVVRLGATYFIADHSALTLDLEYAEADPYIDGADAGRFTSFGLGGETRLATDLPLYATYAVRKVRLDATTETDGIDEVQAGLGVKLLFGGTSSLRQAARAGRTIGLPQLPGRASAWAEFID